MDNSGADKSKKKKSVESDELKRVQKELKRSYKNFLDLFDNSPIGYITIDKHGTVKAANDFTFRIFKINKYDFLEKPFSIYVSREDHQKYFETLKKSAEQQKSVNSEIKLHNHLGDSIYVLLTVCTNLNENKDIDEIKISIVDITLQKEAETRLISCQKNFEEQLLMRTKELEDYNKVIIKQRDKAEEMNRVKSGFLANMSHELRTPMVGILGFSEVIMAESKDNDIKEMASLIHSGGTRLLETLNLILDFTKVESEKTSLNYESIRINEVVKEVISNFKETIQKKRLEIISKSVNEDINAILDLRLFKQILNNLINNAIKYTNEGYIEVSTEISDNKIVLKVKDTGIGIEENKINTLFDEYREDNEEYSRHFSGMGLGLTLAKRFAELMKGTITVESVYKKGSEFTVVLPIEPVESHTASSNETFNGMKALIVEDDEISYSLLKNIINEVCEAEIATNMEEALIKASEYLYDFVIMDINLGSEDTGIDVTRELRTIKGYDKVPIVAVTAYAMKGDRNFFLNSGLDAYVSKPFTRNELIETIKKSIDTVSK